MRKPPRPPALAKPVQPDRQRLNWLLAFLQVDFATLKPGQLLDLRNEIFPYLHEASLATVTVHDDPDLRAFRPARADEADPVVGLARGLLTRLQSQLQAGVTALEERGSWQPFGLTPDRPAPQWSLERRADGTIVRAYCGGWMTITLASAADLLTQWWASLRRCAYPPCGVLFLPAEGRQKYHDPRCSANARWHRFAPKRNYQREKERRIWGTGPRRKKLNKHKKGRNV